MGTIHIYLETKQKFSILLNDFIIEFYNKALGNVKKIIQIIMHLSFNCGIQWEI